MWSDHFEDHIIRILSDEEDKDKREGEDDEAVTYVPEHDSEKEGESDTGEKSRISLLIVSDSVGFDDLLGRPGEVVGREVRWVGIGMRGD